MKAMGMKPVAYIVNLQCDYCGIEINETIEEAIPSTQICECGKIFHDWAVTDEVWPEEALS